MAARLWLACAPLERQHVPGGRHAPVRNAISHPARRFLSKNVGYRVLPTGRLEGFRLRVSWDVSWCTGGYGADESRCPRAERAALSSACNRSVLAKHNRTRVVGSRSDRQGRRYIRGGDAGGAGPGDTGPHVQARSSTPVREQYTRWGAVHPLGSRTPVGEQNTRQERVYCIPIGCSERTDKENHAEVAPPPPAKNRPSAVRTSPSTRTARALPHRAPPHRSRRTQRRQQQPGPTCPARARVVVGRTARQSPPSHAPASQARPRPRHFAASAAL